MLPVCKIKMWQRGFPGSHVLSCVLFILKRGSCAMTEGKRSKMLQ